MTAQSDSSSHILFSRYQKKSREYQTNVISLSEYLLSFENFKRFSPPFHFFHSEYLSDAIKRNIIDFKEAADVLKELQDLSQCTLLGRFLSSNCDVCKILLQDSEVDQGQMRENIRYAVNKISDAFEMNQLTYNTFLMNYTLDNFLLSRETLQRLDTLIESRSDVFDNQHMFLEYLNQLQLSDTSESLYGQSKSLQASLFLEKFSKSDNAEFNELYELLSEHDSVRNNLLQIIDNNLESQYTDFKTVKEVLLRDLKKKKIKMNF